MKAHDGNTLGLQAPSPPLVIALRKAGQQQGPLQPRLACGLVSRHLRHSFLSLLWGFRGLRRHQ